MFQARIYILAVMILLSSSLLFADVPQMLNYQGRLTDDQGDPVSATVSMSFAIYDAESGGNIKWTEAHPSVAVVEGLFAVILGNGSPAVPIDDSVFNAKDRWLEITVNGEIIGSRTRFTSSAYAMATPWWSFTDSVLMTNQCWGIARGGADNMLYGDNVWSHINLGRVCTTGSDGQNRSHATVSGGYGNKATESASTVGGGQENEAAGNSSTVSGGWNNHAYDHSGTVSGGNHNEANGEASAIGGGANNIATGSYNVIGGGGSNETDGGHSTVGGGGSNIASGDNSVVSGGWDNNALGQRSAVGGGAWNSTHASYSTIAGGSGNQALGAYGAIGGGYRDTVNGYYSAVCGGQLNVAGENADDSCAFVGGGSRNQVFGRYASVVGGHENIASGNFAFVGGGDSVVASGVWSVACGGWYNEAYATESVVGGGAFNAAQGERSVVAGGTANGAIGDISMIGGGATHTNRGYGSGISSGYNNLIGPLDSMAYIGGGRMNVIYDEGLYSSILGGYNNTIDGGYSAIAGGKDNNLEGSNSFAFGIDANDNGNDNVAIFDWGSGVGTVFIGRDATSSSYRLYVNGSAFATGIWQSSDLTLKKNVQPLKNVLDAVDNLRPVRFVWKEKYKEYGIEGGRNDIGFIAQDVLNIFPELVNRSSENGLLSINYDHITAINTAAIKELREKYAQIDRLEAELEELKALLQNYLQLPTSERGE